MPRKEDQIEGSGPVVRLAEQLRELRRGAGNPTYRVMAERAFMAPSVLSEAAAGKKLPTWSAVSAYINACGGQPAGWRAFYDNVRQEAIRLKELVSLSGLVQYDDGAGRGTRLSESGLHDGDTSQLYERARRLLAKAAEPPEAREFVNGSFSAFTLVPEPAAVRQPPVPPEPCTPEQFVEAMRRMRTWAGSPSLRKLSEKMGVSHSTLHEAFTKGRLPSFLIMTKFLEACGITSPGTRIKWIMTWKATSEPSPTPTSTSPAAATQKKTLNPQTVKAKNSRRWR